jgi:hypothetical protein
MLQLRQLSVNIFLLLATTTTLFASEAALVARTQERIRLRNRLSPDSESTSLLGDFYSATYQQFSSELAEIPLPRDKPVTLSIAARTRELWQEVVAGETGTGSYLLSALLARPEDAEFLPRFSALVAAGAFTVAPTPRSAFRSLENINYTLLYGFLLRQGRELHRQISGIFAALSITQESYFPFLGENTTSIIATAEYQKSWWEKTSLPLLQHYLDTGNWHAGRSLLAQLKQMGLPFLQQLPPDSSDLQPRFRCVLLETILTCMDEHWNALTSSETSSPLSCDFPWLQALNLDGGSRIFSGSYYRLLNQHRSLGQRALSPLQLKALSHYIVAGIMRNALLKELGREISQQLSQEPGQGLYFYHLARYLTCHENRFLHLSVDSGYERLFFSSPLFSQSVLRTILARGNLLALQKILFLAPRVLFLPQQTSILHLLIEAISELPAAQQAKGEAQALIMLKYLLTATLSAQFSPHILHALTMKNHRGESPLTLAQREAYPLLHTEMKNYLLVRQAYKNEDHKI